MKRLWTTFRYTYTHLRGQILGWGLGLAIYGLMIVPMYDSMAKQQEQLQKLIASYPPEFLAFFGGDAQQPDLTGWLPWDVCFLDDAPHYRHLRRDGRVAA
jgi:hypothetical protein